MQGSKMKINFFFIMKYDFPIIFKFLNSLQDMLNVFEVLLFPSTFCTAVREGMSFFPISMNFFISRCVFVCTCS